MKAAALPFAFAALSSTHVQGFIPSASYSICRGTGLIRQRCSQTSGSSPSMSAATATDEYTLLGKPIGGPLVPIASYILVKVKDKVKKTDGGVVLLDRSVDRPTEGTVVAVGPGRKHQESGLEFPMPCAVGDKVLYGKYDGTSVKYNDKEHQFIRDTDVLFVFQGEEMSPDSIKIIGDQLLVEVEPLVRETATGLLLAANSQDDARCATIGQVVAVGPGRMTPSGDMVTVTLKKGDWIKFREFSGKEVAMANVGSKGKEYRIMKEEEVLVKW